MWAAGIDIGSRTVKFVVVENGEVVAARKAVASYNPLETAMDLMKGMKYERLVATGYGRHLAKAHLNCETISEIKAFARAVGFLEPRCKGILDIGGQDTKAISLEASGNLSKFEMNDKCAAGTGRFLEVMAGALGYTLEEFASAALSAERAEKINSMCTVFAESEVVSLVTRGASRKDVALGIHKAIVSRALSLLRRVVKDGNLFFAGGVALNACVRKLLSEEIGRPVVVPEDPQIVGALGAALCAEELRMEDMMFEEVDKSKGSNSWM